VSATNIWKPHVTVAAVVEHAGRFLLVEEETDEGLRYNQPAGHLDPGESLIAAVRRETVEETAHAFEPRALIGIYHHQVPAGQTYIRFTFCGELGKHYEDRALDTGIQRTLWMTRDEIRASAERHRTPLVGLCVEDYLAGHRYPLELLRGGPG
jgi:ADP-ribose pyrophosphatase YjhB (NUDIX family)